MMKLKELEKITRGHYKCPMEECEKIAKTIVTDYLERNPEIAANPETISIDDVEGLQARYERLCERLKETGVKWSDIPMPPHRIILCAGDVRTASLFLVTSYAIWEDSLFKLEAAINAL